MKHKLVFAYLFTFLLTSIASAQVPALINYQGRLLDGTNLVNTTAGIVLGLFNTESGGFSLYEDSNTITVVDGLYSTYIGDDPVSASFGAALTNEAVYLQVTVNGTALSPRERLSSVAYALVAATVTNDAITSELIADSSITPADIKVSTFSNTFWRVGGNADSTTNAVIGTINSNVFEIHVNGARVIRIEPTATTPNIVAGIAGNQVASGSIGATISGGGGIGGFNNNAAGNFATVAGGSGNDAMWLGATVGGGVNNEVLLGNGTIAGGWKNTVSNFYGTISGGDNNSVMGLAAVIPGGRYNQAHGDYSFAAGLRAEALHDGTFVWADTLGTNFSSSSSNQFLIRAAGGVGIGTETPTAQLTVDGDAHVMDDLEVGDQLHLSGEIRMDTGAGNQYIYFYDNGAPTNEALFWNETNSTERFEFTEHLHIDGTLTAQDDVVAYDDMRIGSSDIDHHLFFFEDGNPTGERLTWDDSLDRFYFSDSLDVGGTLSKGAGAFKIDHPLDPANKYLQHSFVESPDMMNIYNGNVVLDASGEATVELPEWFEALNSDFRYQISCLGGYAPVYIAEEIEGNSFTIAGGSPGLKVSWQVTGTRHDPFAEAHRIPVELEKTGDEKGTYLYPEVYE